MQRSMAQLFGALALAAPLFFSASAFAEPDPAACGNINVSASAECKVEVSGGCEAQCTPLSCEGQCTATASVNCSASCEANCNASCDPGSLDCNASCEADCGANCDGQCSASGNTAECKGSCKASCSSSCDASCTGSPPSCEGSCQASCDGSCTAQANASCQIDCQGGCRVQCQSPDGALFCNGEYVDTGNNFQDCLDYLASIGVEVTGSASADCRGNECTAEAEGSVSCAASPQPQDSRAPLGAIAALAAGLGIVVARRRRA